MSTQLGPADILVRASFPVASPGEGFGFAEFARRYGDFALAGVAVRVRRSPREAVLAAFGVSDRHIRVTAEPSEDGCRLVAEATVYLAGRIAQFGRALAGDVSRRLFEQFAAAVEQAAVSGAAPQASPASPGALRLLASAVTGL